MKALWMECVWAGKTAHSECEGERTSQTCWSGIWRGILEWNLLGILRRHHWAFLFIPYSWVVFSIQPHYGKEKRTVCFLVAQTKLGQDKKNPFGKTVGKGCVCKAQSNTNISVVEAEGWAMFLQGSGFNPTCILRLTSATVFPSDEFHAS